MKKLFLLSFTLLAAAANIFAGNDSDKYWIIKDGKFVTENVTTMPYTGRRAQLDIPNEMKDTVVDGENRVVYKQISYDFLDVKLRLDSLNPIDRSKYQVMVLEYMIPEEHAGTALNYDPNKNSLLLQKPLFFIGFEETFAKLDDAPDINKTSARVAMTAKWGPVNEWVTEKQFIFMNPTYKTIGGIVFSYAREVKAGFDMIHDFPYIKNFYFEPYEAGTPIYAENFEGTFANLWAETVGVGKIKDNSYHGGIAPVVSGKDTLKCLQGSEDNPKLNLVKLFRDYQADSSLTSATDGSKYYDTELLQSLEVEANRDSIVFPGIQIPAGCVKLYSSMLTKKHKNENGNWVDADFSTVAGKDMPIKVKFNTGEIVDLAKEEFSMIWNESKGTVDVPTGATSFDLIFCSMPVGYIVDNIIFYYNYKEGDGLNDYLMDNQFDIDAYVDANGNIVVLNGELIATYNMKGQIASEADKTVVIFVKNEEGAVASKVMVK